MAEVTLNKITGDVVESYTNKDLSLIPAFDSVESVTPAGFSTSRPRAFRSEYRSPIR